MSKRANTTRTLNPLPFQDLDPHRFEDLVRNLIYDFRKWQTIEATGRGGSDEGFDVRAWEGTSEISNVDEENGQYEQVGAHPMEGNLWKIQCKRERHLGPAKVKRIINDGVDNNDPPYGYILVAPTTFSKRSYDLFRNELRAKGVMEFYLWGKAELEDMLFLPKNDNILFAFFGISLVTRKRVRTSEIRFSINNKNKLLRILADGDARRNLHQPILVRDFKDVHYPWKEKYKDFDQTPRWREYRAVAFDSLGLVMEVARRFAFVDRKTKEWDFVEGLNLLDQHGDSFHDTNLDSNQSEKLEKTRLFCRYLRRSNRAQLIVRGVIFFEDMLIVDEKGDPAYPIPQIFVDFKGKSGPFRFFLPTLEVGNERVMLDDIYKRIKFFPKDFPERRKGTIHKDRVLELDSETIRLFGKEFSLNCLFDVSGKYEFLVDRDIIEVGGVKPLTDGEKTFIEITSKYRIKAKDFLKEHLGRGYELQIEWQLQRKLKDSDQLTVLEFERVYAWQIGRE